MAFVRMTLEEAAETGRVDRARIDSTTEEDIRRHMIEDGEGPDASPTSPIRLVESPSSLRAKLGLTQAEIALRLRLPKSRRTQSLTNWSVASSSLRLCEGCRTWLPVREVTSLCSFPCLLSPSCGSLVLSSSGDQNTSNSGLTLRVCTSPTRVS